MLDTIFGWFGYSPTAQLQLAQSRIMGLETLASNLNLVIGGMFILLLILIIALWRRPRPVYITSNECCSESKVETKIEKPKVETKVEKPKVETKVEN